MSAYIDDMFSLVGKVAVTIGSGGVLGGAMAEALGRAGARVAVLDLDAGAAKYSCERCLCHLVILLWD